MHVDHISSAASGIQSRLADLQCLLREFIFPLSTALHVQLHDLLYTLLTLARAHCQTTLNARSGRTIEKTILIQNAADAR